MVVNNADVFFIVTYAPRQSSEQISNRGSAFAAREDARVQSDRWNQDGEREGEARERSGEGMIEEDGDCTRE